METPGQTYKRTPSYQHAPVQNYQYPNLKPYRPRLRPSRTPYSSFIHVLRHLAASTVFAISQKSVVSIES
ncbi:hypothetical protein RhiirA4_455355 [Rhizophagus irregularis]|uniref:Uncharacterized protein n=1 Tax=Rhizophagus irregularis TaxID=588596 RepID=A0A2I1G4Z3_9GLOM|nr:hypothetical protein RhiirA4_455355 [Rhizophagus irregularis]